LLIRDASETDRSLTGVRRYGAGRQLRREPAGKRRRYGTLSFGVFEDTYGGSWREPAHAGARHTTITEGTGARPTAIATIGQAQPSRPDR